MRNNSKHIVIADFSSIIRLGLKDILSKSEQSIEFHFADNLATIESLIEKYEIDLVIINPLIVFNLDKQLNQLKNSFPSILWFAIVSNLYDETFLSQFNYRIHINEQAETILSLINNAIEESRSDETSHRQPLSDRELEVLRLLVMGLSNKEIADKLFISTHTVISHRKNISQKTEIKSVSGLTIYAVVKGIISLNSLPE